MLRANGRRVLTLLLLALVTGANAAPTFNNGSSNVQIIPLSPMAHAIHTNNYSSPTPTSFSEQPAFLTSVAAELLKPPIDFKNTSVVVTRSLPAVPKAILMVLAGFLCISLVRDRRTWLATIAALLWIGQVGLATLPHLASHLCGKKQNEHLSFSDFVELEVASHLRSGNSANRVELLLTQPAIITQKYYPFPFINRLANVAEQPVCFSPRFIFDCLARGPPKLT